MEKDTYRIVEHLGAFTIEVQKEERSGFLGWGKKKKVWYPVDGNGNKVSFRPHIPMTPILTLDQARQKIKQFKTPPRIYTE